MNDFRCTDKRLKNTFSGSLGLEKKGDLNEICYLPKFSLRFYLSEEGNLFWALRDMYKKPLSKIPQELQIPFLLEFIKDHELAERLKFIKDPLVCIELFLKARFVMQGFSRM